MTLPTRARVRGGVLLGLGLGGFFDGIVLHQILQWHHLVSEVYRPTTLEHLKLNTLADGLFHALTWVFTALGVVLLWRDAGAAPVTRQPRTLVGALLLGWGLFNVVEGAVNHQLLGIHHVRPGPQQGLYDAGFLLWGALMLLGAAALLRPAWTDRRPD
jgi:uncharacterized membrane protein